MRTSEISQFQGTLKLNISINNRQSVFLLMNTAVTSHCRNDNTTSTQSTIRQFQHQSCIFILAFKNQSNKPANR